MMHLLVTRCIDLWIYMTNGPQAQYSRGFVL